MSETPSILPETTDDEQGHPRLNRRQAAKVRTRQKVLDAARSLFAERGYEPATIRDIAKGAGMSTGAVFANFQDKSELFEAVLAEDIAGLVEVLRQGAKDSGSVQARMLGALNAGYHATLDQLPLVQAVIARSWFQPDAAEARSRQTTSSLLAVLDDILRDGVRSGELNQDADTRFLGEMIWDAYRSNYRKAAYDGWTAEQLSERLERQIQIILSTALSGR